MKLSIHRLDKVAIAWQLAVRFEYPLRRARRSIIGLLRVVSRILSTLPGTSWRYGPPRHVTQDTYKWAGLAGFSRTEIDPPWLAVRRPRPEWRPYPSDWDLVVNWQNPRTFIVGMPDARAWGPAGVPIGRDDTVLADMALIWTQQPSDLPILHRPWLGRPKRVNGSTGTLVGMFPKSYHHWMLDQLPRLDLLARAGARYDKILVPQGNGFHDETLERAGVPFEKRVVQRHDSYYSFEQLIVPSYPAHSGQAPRHACEFIRDLFGDQLDPDSRGRRIYISRADANRRRITNESEIAAFLCDRGFEVITCSGLSVAQQARLFASAEAVVAPHGGALTNLVFCQPGTKVIELFGPGYNPICYWAIAETLGLEYYPIFPSRDREYNGVQWSDYPVRCTNVLGALRHLHLD